MASLSNVLSPVTHLLVCTCTESDMLLSFTQAVTFIQPCFETVVVQGLFIQPHMGLTPPEPWLGSGFQLQVCSSNGIAIPSTAVGLTVAVNVTEPLLPTISRGTAVKVSLPTTFWIVTVWPDDE